PHYQFAGIIQPHHGRCKHFAETVGDQSDPLVRPDAAGAVGGSQIFPDDGHCSLPYIKRAACYFLQALIEASILQRELGHSPQRRYQRGGARGGIRCISPPVSATAKNTNILPPTPS